MMSITKEDIIQANYELGECLSRPGSLDYAYSRFEEFENNKFKGIAFLLRAIITDHVFSDASKRTCIYICMEELGDCGDAKLSRLMLKISEERINDVDKIEKMLRRCYQKN
jgi:hypothetical protein